MPLLCTGNEARSNSYSVAFDPPPPPPPCHSSVSSSNAVWLWGFGGHLNPWEGGWFCWVALGSARLGPVRALRIHCSMLLLMTAGAPFRCLQHPVGWAVFLCLRAVVWCGGWWNEEERKAVSTILNKSDCLQTSVPLKQGKQKAELRQNRCFTFQQRFWLLLPLCIECKMGRDPFPFGCSYFFCSQEIRNVAKVLILRDLLHWQCPGKGCSVSMRLDEMQCVHAVVHLPVANLL